MHMAASSGCAKASWALVDLEPNQAAALEATQKELLTPLRSAAVTRSHRVASNQAAALMAKVGGHR